MNSSNIDPINILASDQMMIAYRPEFARHLGSVTAAILLQQIIYRWHTNNRKPFYKFKQPCSHEKYREGDSWCEELAFTRYEFDSALKLIGQKVKKGSVKDPEALVYYWINISRETRYDVNYDALHKVVEQLYGKKENSFIKVDETDLDINREYNKEEHTDNSLSLSENAKKSDHRNQDGTLDVNGFLNSVKSESEPKEAPPVAPPPPEMDPEAVIVSKLDPGPTSQLMDVWKMHSGASYEKIAKQFQDFASWWIDKKCIGMSDDEIDTLVARTGSRAFRASFKKSFLPRINNKTETKSQNGTATPKKSNYIRPSDLARLYPEFYPAESGSGTQAANGNNPDPEQEFEIVSEPDGGIFAKHPFA